MNLFRRWVLIVTLSAAFIVLSAFLVLFATGNRINLRNMTIEKVGGIYIASQPADASIFLNNVPVKNSSGILNPGTVINNLISGVYNVSVSKSGYYPWMKEIKVRPGLVSVYENVVLVPKSGGKNFVTGVPASSLKSGISSIVLAGTNLLISTNNGKLYLDGKMINGGRVVDVSGSGSIITYSYLADSYYLTTSSAPSLPLNLSAEFYADASNLLSSNEFITKISFSSLSGQYFLVRTNLALYGMNIATHSVKLISAALSGYASAGNQIYWINRREIATYNPIYQVYGKASVSPADQSEVVDLLAMPDGDELFVLYKDDRLFSIIPGQAPALIASDATSVKISPDGTGVAYTELGGKITDIYASLTKPVAIRTGLNAVSSNISWYDDAHLFLQSGNGLYFSEIDDKNPPLNITEVSSSTRNYAYDSANNILYFTDGISVKTLKIGK